MKQRASLIVAIVVCPLACFVVLAQAPPSKEPEELDRLRKTYQQKRADALEPVVTWYENQLETLQKKLTRKGDLDAALVVRQELDAMKENALQESGAELKKALLATSWSWTDKPDDKGIQMTFKENGDVSHIGMRGKWKITGPREATIVDSTGIKIVLRFDEKLTAYERFGGAIQGRHWQ